MVLSIGCYYWLKKEKDTPLFLAIISAALLVVLIVIWLPIYCTTLAGLAEMEAFFEATKSAYEYTITATQKLEIKAVSTDKPSLEVLDIGELAYQKLGSIASERIKEFRNKAEWYNGKLKRYERWNRFWFTEGFVVDVPEELKLIVL